MTGQMLKGTSPMTGKVLKVTTPIALESVVRKALGLSYVAKVANVATKFYMINYHNAIRGTTPIALKPAVRKALIVKNVAVSASVATEHPVQNHKVRNRFGAQKMAMCAVKGILE